MVQSQIISIKHYNVWHAPFFMSASTELNAVYVLLSIPEAVLSSLVLYLSNILIRCQQNLHVFLQKNPIAGLFLVHSLFLFHSLQKMPYIESSLHVRPTTEKFLLKECLQEWVNGVH